jgi:galactosamine-6-phosphate isomerase
MQIIRCSTVAELNEKAAELVVNDLKSRSKSLFCTATGNSPTGIYQLLVQKTAAFNVDGLTLLKLDEWHNLPMDHPASCEYYVKQYLLGPLGMKADHFVGFNSKADPSAECDRINAFLKANGPIDLCILGLGQNGHLGFNEPADFLQPHAHLSTLSPTSLNHSMIKNSGADIKYGFTLGIADILQSKKIVLPVFGQNKKDIMERLMEGTVYPQLPASFLWLHPDVTCFYCENDN